MKVVKWILIASVGIFGMFFIFAITHPLGPEEERARRLLEVVNASCDQQMSDAALGAERRGLRTTCDTLKADAQRRIQEARASDANK